MLTCCWNDCEWLAWLIELCCVWIGNVLVLRIIDWSYELLIEFLFEFVNVVIIARIIFLNSHLILFGFQIRYFV